MTPWMKVQPPVQAVLHLQDRLDRAYAGHPFNAAIDRCFTRMIEAHALPRALPDALLEGAGMGCRRPHI